MKVFKFGGASVKDATGIRNLEQIVRSETGNLIVVVSALGKTTNALEIVLKSWQSEEKVWKDHLEAVLLYHMNAAETLFPENDVVITLLNNSFSTLKTFLTDNGATEFDSDYDQIVSFGELWSTLLVGEYLKRSGIKTDVTDIRKILITDDRHRDANVQWEESNTMVKANFTFENVKCYVTQGFIGGTVNGKSTTLGREGSDYTAAILANILDAESVTVWKDVPGLLNADPRWFPDAEKLDEVSYREAVEMTFSGAKVIHPKTIKPLQNKQIPLFVKSFISPSLPGTKVTATPDLQRIIPVYIKKENQVLLTLLPRDFSFVMGDNLGRLLNTLQANKIKVNLVEASAVSIDVCVDDDRQRVEDILTELKSEYSALYNEGVEMLTVRHYNAGSVDKITRGREILLEQRTRSTVRFVAKKV